MSQPSHPDFDSFWDYEDHETRPYFARTNEVLSQDAWLVEKESERLSRLKELTL
jgi:hypothetical protein